MKNIVNFRSTSNNLRMIQAGSVEFGKGMKHNFTYPLHAVSKIFYFILNYFKYTDFYSISWWQN